MRVIKVPFSAGSLNKNVGSMKAPEVLANNISKNIQVEVIDINKNNIEETNKNIYNKVLKEKKFCIILGGDHSITYSAFRAFSKNHQDPSLLVFDAHPDCVNDFSPPTHEDYLRVLIEEGCVKPENILLVGLRKIDEVELDYLKEKNIEHIMWKDIENKGIIKIKEGIIEKINKNDNIYLSVDIDVVSPEFAPGTGYIERGGLTSEGLLFLLEKIIKLKKIGMMDLVEINPEKDVDNRTVKLGARILELFS